MNESKEHLRIKKGAVVIGRKRLVLKFCNRFSLVYIFLLFQRRMLFQKKKKFQTYHIKAVRAKNVESSLLFGKFWNVNIQLALTLVRTGRKIFALKKNRRLYRIVLFCPSRSTSRAIFEVNL